MRGAALPVHTDRHQCEYSLSLLVDFDGPAGERSPWPLRFHPEGSTPVSLHQFRGEAVIYRGPVIPHSRPELEAEFSTSIFLHYVDAEFAGPLD